VTDPCFDGPEDWYSRWLPPIASVQFPTPSASMTSTSNCPPLWKNSGKESSKEEGPSSEFQADKQHRPTHPQRSHISPPASTATPASHSTRYLVRSAAVFQLTRPISPPTLAFHLPGVTAPARCNGGLRTGRPNTTAQHRSQTAAPGTRSHAARRLGSVRLHGHILRPPEWCGTGVEIGTMAW
jgi:hypothetical protein